jgi:hypothetical protein
MVAAVQAISVVLRSDVQQGESKQLEPECMYGTIPECTYGTIQHNSYPCASSKACSQCQHYAWLHPILRVARALQRSAACFDQ